MHSVDIKVFCNTKTDFWSHPLNLISFRHRTTPTAAKYPEAKGEFQFAVLFLIILFHCGPLSQTMFKKKKNEKVHRHLLLPQPSLRVDSLGTAGSGASSPADGARPTGTQSFTQSEGLAGIIMRAAVFINNCSLSISPFVPVSSSKKRG